MNTAKEWLETVFKTEVTKHTFEEHFKAIQLEAMKEGARRAADILLAAKWQKGSMNFNQGFISGIIKHTAENWTEKDL